jgi:hypothetical protein
MVCERGCTFNTSCPFGAVTKLTGIVSPMMIFSANEILSPETDTAGGKKDKTKLYSKINNATVFSHCFYILQVQTLRTLK